MFRRCFPSRPIRLELDEEKEEKKKEKKKKAKKRGGGATVTVPAEDSRVIKSLTCSGRRGWLTWTAERRPSKRENNRKQRKKTPTIDSNGARKTGDAGLGVQIESDWSIIDEY